MTIENLNAQDLDYLQRTGFEPPRFTPGTGVTEAPIDLRPLVRTSPAASGHRRVRGACEPGGGAAPAAPARAVGREFGPVGLGQYVEYKTINV
jgi:hypothetical protein